jgi:uncharacterized repeat protein (TIGR01451 family)
MAIKIDGIQSFFDKFKDAFNASNVIKEKGYVKLLNKQQLEERIIREGQRYSTTVSLSGVAVTGASQLVGLIAANSNFKDFYIKNLYISTSADGKFTLEGGITNDITGSEFLILNLAKGVTTLPVNYLQRQNLYAFRLYLTFIVDMYPVGVIAVASNNLIVSKGTLTNLNSGKLSYVATVTNSTGSATSGTITVTDILPSKMKFISGVGTGWTITESNGVITATTTDVIANAGTKTFTIVAQCISTAQVSLSADGYLIDHDIDFDAPAVVWNGTSITAASSPSSYKTAYTYLIRNILRDIRGIRTRVINRAVSGSTSSFHEAARAFDNRYDLPEIPWGAVWEHGINDQVQGISIETTVANALAYIAHWRRISPKIWVFIFAPYPNGSTVIEADLVLRRAALKTAVQALNDPYTKYLESTGTLFNPVTQGATYLADGTHLNDAGNALVATAFANETAALNFVQL